MIFKKFTRLLLQQSFGGGNTGRITPSKSKNDHTANEFVSFARFIEDSVHAYSPLDFKINGSQALVPPFINGRFISVSPEHSLCRAGGDGGGSGVASYGVGRRGQLGNGSRMDCDAPRLLTGGLGYGIKIVQISAGGGLVRVAHSLLLTSMGKVLSFGTGARFFPFFMLLSYEPPPSFALHSLKLPFQVSMVH